MHSSEFVPQAGSSLPFEVAGSRHQAVREFLFARTNYEHSPPRSGTRARVFKLTRMRALLERLGNPETRYPIVHITGTKGKGSTAALVGAILAASGKQVGIFTSPHLERVEERLAVDGRPCPADEFTRLLEELIPLVRSMDQEAAVQGESGPTYFEILTAMAFLYFARRKVDAAVIEVGLGGRLDSTNVCRPEVSVITSISYDHTDLLGTTLEQIAWEKAGIIKRGVPVVSGVVQPGPREVIRRVCKKRGCALWELGEDFGAAYRTPRHLERETALGHVTLWGRPRESAQESPPGSPTGWEIESELRLLGQHQAANSAVAVAAVKRLEQRLGWTVSPQAIQVALRETGLPARVEILGRRPVVVLDAAHNVASAEALVTTLQQCLEVQKCWLLFATTQGKDYRGMLRVFAPFFSHAALTHYTINPRALPVSWLVEAAEELMPGRYSAFENPAAAWEWLWPRVGKDDLVCIAGSFFLAAEMQPHLRKLGLITAGTGSKETPPAP